MRISGVADSTTLGAAVYSMRLWMNPDRMAGLNLTASDVINAIKQQNVQVSRTWKHFGRVQPMVHAL
jgi:multidrug efflux pump subunit AcrB